MGCAGGDHGGVAAGDGAGESAVMLCMYVYVLDTYILIYSVSIYIHYTIEAYDAHGVEHPSCLSQTCCVACTADAGQDVPGDGSSGNRGV